MKHLFHVRHYSPYQIEVPWTKMQRTGYAIELQKNRGEKNAFAISPAYLSSTSAWWFEYWTDWISNEFHALSFDFKHANIFHNSHEAPYVIKDSMEKLRTPVSIFKAKKLETGKFSTQTKHYRSTQAKNFHHRTGKRYLVSCWFKCSRRNLYKWLHNNSFLFLAEDTTSQMSR